MATSKGIYDPTFVPLSNVSTSGKNETGAHYVDNIVSPYGEEKDGSNELKPTSTRRSEIPDTIKNLSPEERKVAEKKLLRRIDFRLLPMLVLMYIMNYLVCTTSGREDGGVKLIQVGQEQHCCGEDHG
jgi:hypothetical protein